MTTPSTSAQGPAAGWKLVPTVPTLDMQKAYFDEIDRNMHRVETDCTFGRFDNHRVAYAKMLTASPPPAASPASPSGVRVKPLEWIGLSDSCIAHTPFGVYKVAQAGETVNMFIARSELPKSFHATLDEAKAAAQSDFETRIRSALVSGSREDGDG